MILNSRCTLQMFLMFYVFSQKKFVKMGWTRVWAIHQYVQNKIILVLVYQNGKCNIAHTLRMQINGILKLTSWQFRNYRLTDVIVLEECNSFVNLSLTCRTGLAIDNMTLCAMSFWPRQLKITSQDVSDVSSRRLPSRIALSILMARGTCNNTNCDYLMGDETNNSIQICTFLHISFQLYRKEFVVCDNIHFELYKLHLVGMNETLKMYRNIMIWFIANSVLWKANYYIASVN